MKLLRHYSFLDKICLSVDQAVRALTDNLNSVQSSYPAKHVDEPHLNASQKKHSAALMRINHAGEICAQALYHGQALVSKTQEVQEKMQQSAKEEGEHLAWCKQRLHYM